MRLVVAISALACVLGGVARATTYTVAASGGDFTTIQAALDVAVAGDTIQVRRKATPYGEKLVFPRSGNASSGFISLEAYPGEQPVLDGTGLPAGDMVLIDTRSYVRVSGLEIRNDLNVHDASGIRVLGSGAHVELLGNDIHDIRGADAMGITVYGTDPATPISDLVIDGNTIHDCDPAHSEALALNGNVTSFAVTNNVVRDVNNIGIVFIGGEKDIQPDQTKVARSGVCRGNTVIRARSVYGGGFAGGIYVDGGRDIVVEHNVVTQSDLGLEVDAENTGVVASNVTVRDNVLYANEKAGLVFGGFAAGVGRVKNCTFENNTVYHNDTLGAGFGELWIQYAEDNLVRNNLFVATAQGRLVTSDAGNVNTTVDYNLWWADAAAGAVTATWNGAAYTGYAAYQAGTGQDAHSPFVNPLLVNPAAADFHLGPGSPAIDVGDPAFVAAAGETDLDGALRVNGPRVDAGADEATTCGDGVTTPPEQCDDGNAVDGDGCDSNCTVTACGNGIVTAGEQCDDGNTAAGDCCSPTCQLEPNGAACDDGDPCTNVDACTAGVCTGAAAPATGCRAARSGTVQLRNTTPDKKDVLVWHWKQGAATSAAELGAPTTTTGYALCVYDAVGGVPVLRLGASLPGGARCRSKACWKVLGSGAVKYADRDGAAHGVTGLLFKPGAPASLTLKGKGGHLALAPFPLAQQPAVTLQLKRTDAPLCWESVFTAPATHSDGAQFKDKLP